MNDQSQMMNQPPQLMMTGQVQVPVQPQMMNQSHQFMAAAAVHSQALNQLAAAQVQSQAISSGPPIMNMPPQMRLNRTYKPWQSQDPNLNPNHNKKYPPFSRNNNWKGKKANSGKDSRKLDNKPLPVPPVSGNASVSAAPGSSTQGYKPPTLNELQSQNRLKSRKFYGKKRKFSNNSNNRFAPYAPWNTTSFIIRAKKSGGIASLVSPCPVTPAVLPTPIFSPSREVLGDMAKEEWGVDGYGSMKGLIRLRSPGHEEEEDDDGGNGGGSSESDVEEHVEVERRLDHDLSRFEMIYPSHGGDYNNVLENRVDDQDTHIAQLEEENLTLKERLFLMERELGDLRRRLLLLERQSQVVEELNEGVVENGSDKGSEGGDSEVKMTIGDADNKNVQTFEFAAGNSRNVVVMDEDNNDDDEMPHNEGPRDAHMGGTAADDDIAKEGELNNEKRRSELLKDLDEENEAKGDEAGGCNLVQEKVLEEEKYVSRYDEARKTKN